MTDSSSAHTDLVPAAGPIILAAYLIDLVCVLIVASLLYLFFPSLLLSLVICLEFAALGIFLVAITGRTPGLMAMRTRLVSVRTHQRPGLAAALRFGLPFAALHLTIFGPLVMAGLANDGQTFLNRFSGTSFMTPGSSEDVSRSHSAGYGKEPPVPAPTWEAPQATAGHTSVLSPIIQQQATVVAPPTTAPFSPVSTIPQPPHPSFTAPASPAGAPSVGAQPHSATQWYLVFDDGKYITVAGRVLLGGAPSNVPDGTTAYRITDAGGAVAAQHLLAQPIGDFLEVTDLGSTSGTHVMFPDGRVLTLRPHTALQVQSGCQVQIGGRVFRVATDS